MRIAPVGMIHGMLSLTLDDLVRDVYETCIPTHNTTVCVSSAAAVAAAVCGAMKMATLEGIADVLENMSNGVELPAEVVERARRPVERMIGRS